MAQQPQPPRHPVDAAQAMLNLVFMQTGRFFVDPALRDSKRAQSGVKMIFPTALNNFHQALDELEVKIARAQQTMRRDLALLQAAREQKDAEAAAKERVVALPPIVKDKAALKPMPMVVDEDVSEVVETSDVEMQDLGAPKNEATAPTTSQIDVKQPTPLVEQPTQVTQPTKPPPIQTQNNDNDDKSAEAEAGPLTATGTDDLFGRTPTTAGVNQFDLDSMFENTADPPNPDVNNGDDLDFNLDDHTTGASLLQGIEEFANPSNDLSMDATNITSNPMLDISSDLNTTIPTTGDASTSQAISQPTQTQADTSTADFSNANYDDLFGGGDYGDGQYLDLDDDLLNAPENTAFDDAFDDAWFDTN